MLCFVLTKRIDYYKYNVNRIVSGTVHKMRKKQIRICQLFRINLQNQQKLTFTEWYYASGIFLNTSNVLTYLNQTKKDTTKESWKNRS